MKLAVIEKSTGKVVYTTEVNLAGQNYVPKEAEYHDLAWHAAVEDGAVQEVSRAQYSFVQLKSSAGEA